MRVRMIRPAYWTDADLHTRLTAEQREFYVGLWMEADDAGYIAWDVDRIGADLYPYKPLRWRRAKLPEWVAVLAPHVEVLDCGIHLLIPALSRHNPVPRPSYQNRRAHEGCIRQMAPHGATWDHMGADGTTSIREGKGRERKGITENAAGGFGETIGDGMSEFVRKVAAAKV